ncbi:hypothetical protein [Caballeronia cordobensis]
MIPSGEPAELDGQDAPPSANKKRGQLTVLKLAVESKSVIGRSGWCGVR